MDLWPESNFPECRDADKFCHCPLDNYITNISAQLCSDGQRTYLADTGGLNSLVLLYFHWRENTVQEKSTKHALEFLFINIHLQAGLQEVGI